MRRSPSRLHTCAWVAVLILGLTGCDDSRETVVEDLAAVFEDAVVLQEPARLDLGSHTARPHLADGWGHNERGEGRDWVWSLGERAMLRFELVEPRVVHLELAGWPVSLPGLPPQRVGLEVNGVPAGEFEMRSGPAVYTARLPRDVVRTGENELAFHYAWSVAPAEQGGGDDRRRLAAAWDWIRFDGRDAGARPTISGKGVLTVPPGSRIDFFVRLPPAAALRVDEVTAGATAELTILRDNATEEILELPGSGPGRWPLGQDEGLARLRLAVPAEGAAAPAPALRLVAPRIVAPGMAQETSDPVPTGIRSSRPNIVVYMVDTLRADHLGAYGGSVPTPHFDAFADTAVLFERAVAQSSWTKAAVASIFTGLWPPAHGAVGIDDELSAELPGLAGLLAGAGYETVAIVANAFVSETFGFARDFERFHFFRNRLVRSDRLHQQVVRWLDQRASEGVGRPFFLYVHTIDPHVPYDPPTELRRELALEVSDPELGSIRHIQDLKRGRASADAGEREQLVRLYDAEIAYNDRQFGRLLEALAERGLEDDTVVVVTSDHGEAFEEHGRWTHGLDLHREVLGVPLLVRTPGFRQGRRVTEPVQHIDLFPTLLELAGIEPPSGSGPRGRSLLPWIEADGPATPEERAIYSHLDYVGHRGASVLWREWKLILPLSRPFGDTPLLFDLSVDPGETVDLAAKRPVVAGYLETLIRRQLRLSRPPGAVAAELDAETTRQLEALGYLD